MRVESLAIVIVLATPTTVLLAFALGRATGRRRQVDSADYRRELASCLANAEMIADDAAVLGQGKQTAPAAEPLVAEAAAIAPPTALPVATGLAGRAASFRLEGDRVTAQ